MCNLIGAKKYRKDIIVFEVGDLIVYGNTGVCTVVEIGPLAIGSQDRDYYTLEPFYSPKSRVFTPCDNEKVVMRPILSKKEVEDAMEEFSAIALLVINEEKKREEIYKASMHTCDIRDLISLLKTINSRKQMRLAQGKKVTASDEKYYTMAGEKLCDEISIVMGVGREEIRDYIRKKIEASQA